MNQIGLTSVTFLLLGSAWASAQLAVDPEAPLPPGLTTEQLDDMVTGPRYDPQTGQALPPQPVPQQGEPGPEMQAEDIEAGPDLLPLKMYLDISAAQSAQIREQFCK